MPDTASGRVRCSLNPGWGFAGEIGDPSSAPGSRGPFEVVHLPHTVTALSWRDWDPASWEGLWHYRRAFDLAGSAARYVLRFEGVMSAAYPWLNGTELAGHIGGYVPFECEITELAAASGNQLDVVVDGRWQLNTPPNRPAEPNSSVDLWQPAGLYRDVTLFGVPANYLADVFAIPRNVLDPQRRAVTVRSTVDTKEPGHAVLEAELSDASGVLARTEAEVTLESGRSEHVLTLDGLGDVELWSPEHPRRYRLTVRLSTGDEYQVDIGLRQAEFTKEGFFLNGERLQLFGTGRHHYFPFAGSAMPSRVQRRDAEILKQHGHNMVRCTVYPQDVSFLDACDELGLLVYDEAPGWGFLGDAQWQERSLRDIREMIIRDRNHPSVVLWGARLNETPDNDAFYTRAQELVVALDDSRQTTGAMIFFRYDSTSFQQDVFSYNDYARADGSPYPRLRPPRRDRPYLVSEAVGALAGPARFYRRTDPVRDQHGQAVAHALVHEMGRTDPRYCGVLGWAAYDYQSANGNQQHGVKSPGVFDMFREPKFGAAIYRAQLDPAIEIVLEPAFYWDFDGQYSVHELGAEAMIFANVDRLELFCDGVYYDTLHPDSARFPNLPHAPFVADFRAVDDGTRPELRIDGYLGEQQVISRRFASDSEGDRLAMRVDDAELVADGADATRVVFRTVDRYGALRPPRPGQLRLELTGPATLLGDNPFPLDETGGTGAVWLRAPYRSPGSVRLLATHELLGTQTVDVRVRDCPYAAERSGGDALRAEA